MRAPKVLFCDDDPALLRSLRRMAMAQGLVPITNAIAADSVSIARSERPDVIVLDLTQEIDGRDLLRDLRADEQTRGCKIIMLSGWDDLYTRQTCLELGADDYQLKPPDSLLMSRIARMAHQHAAGV